jgi:hypothetical protein
MEIDPAADRLKGWEMKVVIIVPTCNGRENICRLIGGLEAQHESVINDR